jgi:hypothetical protein
LKKIPNVSALCVCWMLIWIQISPGLCILSGTHRSSVGLSWEVVVKELLTRHMYTPRKGANMLLNIAWTWVKSSKSQVSKGEWKIFLNVNYCWLQNPTVPYITWFVSI